MGVKRHVVLIGSSLMINGVEHLFLCLLGGITEIVELILPYISCTWVHCKYLQGTASNSESLMFSLVFINSVRYSVDVGNYENCTE